MTQSERIQGLLESNNLNVEKKRALKRMLEKCEVQFTFYAKEHRAEAERLIATGDRSLDTEQAVRNTMSKCHVNEDFALQIRIALQPY